MPRTLAQNAQYIAETIKPAIKSAIEAQGVTVPSTDSFLDYADRIAEIEGGGSGYQLKDLPTGSISTVTDAAELPLNALKVSVEAWQEGTGDPSPSNIRPIHGWDSGEITVVGKNLFNKDDSSILTDRRISTGNGNTYTSSGSSVSEYIEVLEGVSYTLTAGRTAYYAWYSESAYISGGSWGDGGSNVAPTGAKRIRFDYPTDNVDAVQLELGTTATTYEPYQGNQYTQQFPTTIYGAEWDVVDGTHGNKVTHKCIEFTSSDNTAWYKLGDSSIFYTVISPLDGKAPTNYGVTGSISSLYNNVTKRVSALEDGEFVFNSFDITSSRNSIVVCDDRFTTAEDFKASLTTPLQVRYELATPTIIDLSPLSIRLLKNTNNLYADCGEVIEGEYFVGSSGAYDLYDYIQTDGTQCIDLGVKVNSGDVINCMYMPLTGMTNWNWLWLAEDTNTNKFSGVVFMSSTQMADYDYSVEANRRNWAADQINISNFTASNNINANIKFSDGAIVKLYSFSINGDDYLPCKRRSDGKFGLYDVKNNTFLTDSASGNAFVGGNNLGVRIG